MTSFRVRTSVDFGARYLQLFPRSIIKGLTVPSLKTSVSLPGSRELHPQRLKTEPRLLFVADYAYSPLSKYAVGGSVHGRAPHERQRAVPPHAKNVGHRPGSFSQGCPGQHGGYAAR